jgi:hypothetical protein
VPIPKSINVGKGSSASGTVWLKTQAPKYKPLTTSTKTGSIPSSQTPGGNSGKGSHVIDFPEALPQGKTRMIYKADSPVWKSLKPYKGKTRTNGLSGKRKQYYEWDYKHNDIEVFDHKFEHLGSMNPRTGDIYKPAKYHTPTLKR